MTTLKRIQRDAYLLSRTAGDVDAARRGVYVKRRVRRMVTRRLLGGWR